MITISEMKDSLYQKTSTTPPKAENRKQTNKQINKQTNK